MVGAARGNNKSCNQKQRAARGYNNRVIARNWGQSKGH